MPVRPIARALVAVVVIAAIMIPAGPARLIAAECWLPPVDAAVADPFRAPPCPWCPGNRGIEFGTDAGTVVRAVRGGIVTFAGPVAGTGYVVVEHPNGWRVTYGGVSGIRVGRGDIVVGRSVLGATVGRLHFGVREGRRYLDPAPYLGRAVFRVRLVPLDGTAAVSAGPPRLACTPTGATVRNGHLRR